MSVPGRSGRAPRERAQYRQGWWAALLALLPVPVLALGLGQLQVKSGPGQPLLAEIPIVSSDPTELQGLQARLAAPETFRRIGLAPPQGVVSELQFAPALDERGRPIIRVTSRVPVQEATLSFLVEVDWGQGRLVREYSALIDAPRTVAAPAAPPVQAPVAEAAPVIQRVTPPQSPAMPAQTADAPVPRSEPAPAPAVAPPPPQVDPKPASAPAPVAVAPPARAAPLVPPAQHSPAPAAPAPATPAPSPAENRRATAAAQTPPARASAQQQAYGPVKRGQTLSDIAAGLSGTDGYSLDQTMLALVRTNPDAFIGDDVNRLREGAVLRMPDAAELSRYSASQAAALVREQVAGWRQSRRAQAQPATVPRSAAAAPQQAERGQTTTPAASQAQAAQARLAIAPPAAASATRAGIQSGISAGGEGDMLKQELQQTRENLAARDAEVQELKARVSELERLQKDQQRLIEMKDNALAGAQQTLDTGDAADNASATQSGWSWSWSLLPLLLVVAAVAWWLGRRRAAAASAPATRGVRLSDQMSANTATPNVEPAKQVQTSAGAAHGQRASDAQATDSAGARAQAIAEPRTTPSPAAPSAPSTATSSDVPLWVGKARVANATAAPATPPARSGAGATPAATPTWVGGQAGAIPPSAPSKPAVAGSDRIELARAYLDLGDRTTARSLLQEVASGSDPAAREEAARLLRSLA